MALRKWSKPQLFLSLKGDEDKARSLVRQARIYAGYLFDQLFPRQKFKMQTWTQPDGTKVEVRVWRDILGDRAVAKIYAPSSSEIPTIFLHGGFVVLPHDDTRQYADAFIDLVVYYVSNEQDAKKLYLEPAKSISMRVELDTEKLAGPISWYGQKDGSEAILTWDHGMASRYKLTPSTDLECSGRYLYTDIDGGPIIANEGKTGLYLHGERIDTEYPVVGAGIFNDTLVYVTYRDLTWEPNPEDDYNERLVSKANADSLVATFFASSDLGETWTQIGTVQAENARFKAPWFFSPDGQKAATVMEWGSLRCDVYEVTIIYFDGELTLTFDIEERSYPYPTATFPTVGVESENVLETGQGPDGDLSAWSYGPWMVCYPGTTHFSGDFDSMSGLHTKLYTFADSVGTPNAAAFTKIDEHIALANAATDLAMTGTYFPTPSVNSYGNPDLDGFVWTEWQLTNEDYFAYVKWKAVRDVYAQTGKVEQIETFTPAVNLKRLVAVDYAFDGEKLYVEQEFVLGDTEYVRNSLRYYSHQSTASASGNSNVTEVDTNRIKESYKADMRWELRVNDETLVTAASRIGEESGDEYTQTFTEVVTTVDSVASSDRTYSDDQGVSFFTERVALLDMDARTKSAIYTRSRVSGEIAGNSDVSEEEIMLVRGMTKVKNGNRTDYMEVVHNGKVAKSQEVQAGSSSGIETLYGRGSPLWFVPRMFALEDKFEDIIPTVMEWPGFVEGGEQMRRWRTPGIDCWPPKRKPGSLAVRDPIRTALCFDDASVVGEEFFPCSREQRDFNIVGLAFVGAQQADICAAVRATIDSDESLPNPGTAFRLNPVRAV